VVVAAVAVAALIVYLLRGGKVPALTWACLLALVALWTAECLSDLAGLPVRAANQSRYQYVPVVLLLLATAALLDGWRPRAGGAVLLGAAVAFVCAQNVSLLDARAEFWRDGNSPYTTALTGVLQVARGIVPPSFMPEDFLSAGVIKSYSLLTLSAGTYFSAADAFGSPADSPAALLREPQPAREAADLVLGQAEGLGPKPASRSLAGACRTVASGPGPGELAVGPGSVAVQTGRGSPAVLSLRRFASDYKFVRFLVVPGSALVLRIPRDHATLPWHIRLTGGHGVKLCVS
jgi:hypothetical protein